ncbi:MAG: ribulose-phosphate 3-epimerase [candidate division WOR-3 bacterium]|nr:ribulose-phosphate 3-epimerase [candidate division WOR-3 bacterium]MDW8113510.1 ribulose-phosphate 3-epimerase [candidate division WOR-3 bacterium]
MHISASILNCNFLKLEEEIKKVEEAGIDSFHLDVMDGHFVPNLSFGTPIFNALKKIAKKPIITHLMVLSPIKMVDWFANGSLGIIFHYEAMNNEGELKETIKKIKEKNLECGIALNPPTPIEEIFPYLSEINEILVMSVYPGFGGQKFIPEVIKKIENLKKLILQKNLKITISVDGGVGPENSKQLISAGVDKLIIGSAIFKEKDYSLIIKKIKDV